MIDQGVDVPKVHIGEPVNFIEVLYRNVGKSDLQAQKCLKDSCTTKAHCIMMTAHQSWEAGAHCTDSRHSNRLENISVMSVGLSLFQEARLVLVPSRHSCCSLLPLGCRGESGFQKSLLFFFSLSQGLTLYSVLTSDVP